MLDMTLNPPHVQYKAALQYEKQSTEYKPADHYQKSKSCSLQLLTSKNTPEVGPEHQQPAD
jgi:hypothetical protein